MWRHILQEEVDDLAFVALPVFVRHIAVAEAFAQHLFRIWSLRKETQVSSASAAPIVGLDEELGNTRSSVQAAARAGGSFRKIIFDHPKTEIRERAALPASAVRPDFAISI